MEDEMSVYKRMIFIFITGIMMIGMLTFSTGRPVKSAVVVIPAGSDGKEGTEVATNTTVTPEPTEEVTPEPTAPEPTEPPVPTVPADNPLRYEIYPDIHDLIQEYYDAKAAADIDKMKTLVTDPVYISTETITAQSEFVKGYSDLKCYTKRGGGEIDFVVYCTVNMLVSTLETPIASLESFYIIYKDGKPMIFSGVITDEATQAILNTLDNDDDVVELKDYTLEAISAAAEADPAVYEFWQKLINAVGTEEDSTTPDQEQ